VTTAREAAAPGGQPRPDKAIDARRRAAAAKVTAVEKAVKTLGRAGAPITRAGIAQLAGVSRSFTYDNDKARAMITEAQARTQARVTDRVETMTAQQEASWRERALNGEDQIRTLRRELTLQRRLVADLMGQLRQPDGTWIADDRNRLREANEQLTAERDRLARERNELQRRLDGARANITHLNAQRVTDLFPDSQKDTGRNSALPAPPPERSR
jgi:chromosome segregation ATPase